MPNWCDNNLTIYGTKEKIKEIEGVVKAYSNFYYSKARQGEEIEGYDLTDQKILRKPDGNPMGLLYYCKPEPDYKTTPVAKTFPEIAAKYANSEEEREIALKNEPTIREDSWYDWRLQNWGCKWEVEAEIGDVDEECICLYFMSPWGPPIEAYEALLKQEGITGIDANYYEPGCAFAGVHMDGKHEQFDVEKLTPEDFKNNEAVKELNECHYLFSDRMQSNPLQLRPELEPVMKGLGIEDCWDFEWEDLVKIYETLKEKTITPGSITTVNKGPNHWPTHFIFNNEEYEL